MEFLVPSLVQQLQSAPTTKLQRSLHDKSLTKLTSIGSQYPAHFKATMQAHGDLRAKLETAIKAQRGQQAAVAEARARREQQVEAAAQAQNKPSITLKMDFSNFNKKSW